MSDLLTGNPSILPMHKYVSATSILKWSLLSALLTLFVALLTLLVVAFDFRDYPDYPMWP